MTRGYDAVDRDPDPSVRAGRRRSDEHGTQIAGVLAGELPEQERILAVRVAGLQRDAESGGRDEFATTDQLMSGLEYVVDPDRDGDVSDHVPVALAALNSPYAGFPDTPEAEAAEAARSLGTLVVAAAGNEGRPGGYLAASAPRQPARPCWPLPRSRETAPRFRRWASGSRARTDG